MIALVLAGLLARTETPAPEPTPAQVEPAASRPPLVRRGVDTTPHVAPGDVTIRNSGSTNVLGYTIVVHASGDADVTVNGTTTPKTLPAAQTKWLFEKVLAATPLDAMPATGCMKSASFGTTTTVSYGGTTSPDVSCGGDAATREIARTVGIVVSLLDVRPERPAHRLAP